MSEKIVSARRLQTGLSWRLRRIIALAALCPVLVLFSIEFIDRPVEAFVAAHQRFQPFFDVLAGPSLLSLPFACVFLLSCGFRAISGVRSGQAKPLFLTVSLAIIAATALKDELKWAFGRPWPRSWIEYGVYAFHPFQTGSLYGGFPSGHTAYITAPMCVLWVLAPRYRVLWGGLIAMVMIGLVGAGYHFVGDTIAGFFVGLTAAAGTLALMPAARKSHR